MPLYTNDGGVTELEEVYCNDGGVTELEKVYCNDGGITYELFSAMPSSLLWRASSCRGAAFPQAVVKSMSDNGLTVTFYEQCERTNLENQTFVYTEPFKLKAGTKITYTVSDISGDGSVKPPPRLYIQSGSVYADAYGYNVAMAETAVGAAGYTIPADGEYHLEIIGSTYTVTGSQSGTTTTHYPIEGTIHISFSK